MKDQDTKEDSILGLPAGEHHKVGQVLLAQGKLTDQQVQDILVHQEYTGGSFGGAGIDLKLLSEQDVSEAIALQFDYAILAPNAEGFSDELHVAYAPFGNEAEAIRALRSQLLLNCLEKGKRAITVLAPSRESGVTYLTVNLAISFAQLGLKACVVEANLRTPRIAEVFALPPNTPGLSDILLGNIDVEGVILSHLFPNLGVVVAGRKPPNPQELLGRHDLVWTLSTLLNSFDVVLFDTPPTNSTADAYSVAARVGAALMVARQHKTIANDVSMVTEELLSADIELVGTVLNKF